MNSKNVIAICAYNKADLLFLYLEQLFSDDTIADYKIEIHTEEGFDPEQTDVLNIYRGINPAVEIEQIIKPKHPSCPLTGFHNILSAYLEPGYKERTCDFVIVGEEDILPTKDYIRFNKYIYDTYLKRYPRIMGASHKRRPETELTGEPELLIGDYQCCSLSVISAEAINKYLLPHFSREIFFQNPLGYYSAHFRDSRMSTQEHTHHDGAVERIMENNNLFVLKPDQARSMHVGLSGIFCKGEPPQGTLEERLVQWRELIKDGDKLRALSSIPHDMVVTDPEGQKWNDLYLDVDRNQAKASSWWYDTENEFKKYIDEKSNTNRS